MNISTIRNVSHVNWKFFSHKMSTFVSRTNPLTGKLDWIVQNDDYDYHQEVARSAYADMLHDTERNQMYDEAICKAVKAMHQQGKQAIVLDIGTGTGLLSMMAARCGADKITACEAFRPMSECAMRVIKDNGLADKIRVIPKRSTELTVGPDGDLSEKANILVTEVFDTELIGEGALGTFQHAHDKLLETGCIVVPTSATVIAQVVSSAFFRKCNTFEPISLPNGSKIVPPKSVTSCRGAAAVHDLQLDQVSQKTFVAITEPVSVFRFDFSGRDPPAFRRYSTTSTTVLRSSIPVIGQDNGHVTNRHDTKDDCQDVSERQCDAVFMWWQLEMDTDGQIILSTAPRWAHPTPENMQWRDHWMQAVYYPANPLSVVVGEKIVIHSYHDEYSLWFDVSKGESVDRSSLETPACSCMGHIACCRTRVGMLNDSLRNNKYAMSLSSVVNSQTVCLSLGEASLLPLVAAKLGAGKVYVVDNGSMSQRLLNAYIDANSLQSSVTLLNKSVSELTLEDFEDKEINLLIGEPFFSTSTLPWHNLHFLYARSELALLLAADCVVMPIAATIKAVAVEFEHLWKIRSAVGICEGFNIGAFDSLIENSSIIADAYVEPHPLWEYPARPLTPVFDLLNINLTKSVDGIRTVEREGSIDLCMRGRCNGLAVWMEYRLDADHVITTGLLSSPVEGQNLEWDPHTRQGVHLFRCPVDIDPSNGTQHYSLQHRVTFKPRSGDIDFQFLLVPSASADILIM